MKIRSFSVPLAVVILGLAGGVAYGQSPPQTTQGPAA